MSHLQRRPIGSTSATLNAFTNLMISLTSHKLTFMFFSLYLSCFRYPYLHRHTYARVYKRTRTHARMRSDEQTDRQKYRQQTYKNRQSNSDIDILDYLRLLAHWRNLIIDVV